MSEKQPPWIEHPNIWATKASFFSFLRGGIRRSLWNRSAIKLEFLKKNRKRIPNPNPKGKAAEVWGARCYICGNDYPLNQINVDHVVGNHSLKEMSDIQSFIENIVCVSFDELALVCLPCHKCKSHAEKKGISFEAAVAEKEAIRLCKENKDVDWLEQRGIIASTTKAKRRTQIEKILLEELAIDNA